MCAAGTCHIIVNLLAEFGCFRAMSYFFTICTACIHLCQLNAFSHMTATLKTVLDVQNASKPSFSSTDWHYQYGKSGRQENYLSHYHKPVSGISKNAVGQPMECTIWYANDVKLHLNLSECYTQRIMIRTQSVLIVHRIIRYRLASYGDRYCHS